MKRATLDSNLSRHLVCSGPLPRPTGATKALTSNGVTTCYVLDTIITTQSLSHIGVTATHANYSLTTTFSSVALFLLMLLKCLNPSGLRLATLP